MAASAARSKSLPRPSAVAFWEGQTMEELIGGETEGVDAARLEDAIAAEARV